MADVSDDNHDGSTQPLPINDPPTEDTVPFDHVPIAEPATAPEPLGVSPTFVPQRRSWAPWLLVGVLGLALIVLTAVVLSNPTPGVSPSPTPSAPTSASPTPSDSGEPGEDPGDTEPPPPPDPEPTPTPEPTGPEPTPTP